MRKLFLFLLLVILVATPVHAKNTGVFSENYFCGSETLKWLFNLSCEGVDASSTSEPEESPRTIQFRFFTPPIPTSTPTNTPVPLPTVTPDNSGGLGGGSGENPALASAVTSQVDWVFAGEGRCWAAWAQGSCSLISHEGGGSEGLRDLDGNGGADITCSQGTGTSETTTVTNISSQSFELACERYACNSCMSGNGTHAQCDGGIDPSSVRITETFTITPGCTATCSYDGAYGSCLSRKEPINPTSTPTNTPVPGQPQPTNTPTPRPGTPTTPTRVPPTPTRSSSASPTPPRATPTPSRPYRCAFGTGHCSVENLMRYFPNRASAEKASMVCQAESGSNPLNHNKACLINKTLDYSIGLFQINLIAHCPEAIRGSGRSCTILNQTKLVACQAKYENPDNNIKFAVSLSHNGTRWSPWSWTANHCGIL